MQKSTTLFKVSKSYSFIVWLFLLGVVLTFRSIYCSSSGEIPYLFWVIFLTIPIHIYNLKNIYFNDVEFSINKSNQFNDIKLLQKNTFKYSKILLNDGTIIKYERLYYNKKELIRFEQKILDSIKNSSPNNNIDVANYHFLHKTYYMILSLLIVTTAIFFIIPFQVQSLLLAFILLFSLIPFTFFVYIFSQFNNIYLGDEDLLYYTDDKVRVTQLKYSDVTKFRYGFFNTLAIETDNIKPTRIFLLLYTKKDREHFLNTLKHLEKQKNYKEDINTKHKVSTSRATFYWFILFLIAFSIFNVLYSPNGETPYVIWVGSAGLIIHLLTDLTHPSSTEVP
jgi:hypothetical protein